MNESITDEVHVRLMEPLRDAYDLIELFETVFGHTVTPHMWAWKCLPPWAQRHYAYVGTANDKVIGYFGAVPLRGTIHGVETPFFQLADIMVHPEHRRRHDYFSLGTKAIFEDLAREHPTRVLYGFSNHKAFRWLERVGLSALIEKTWHRDVLVPGSALEDRLSVVEWEWSQPALDALWEERRAIVPIGLIRDAQYLHWRYRDHPVHRYALHGILRDGEPVGWIVRGNDGIGRPNRPKEVPVIDALIPAGDELAALGHLAKGLGHPVRTWLPNRLAANVPKSVDSGTHAYLFPKDSAVSIDQMTESLYYTMGDVDWW